VRTWGSVVVVAATACGRVDFDPLVGDAARTADSAGSSDVADACAVSLPATPAMWLRMDSLPATDASGHSVTCPTQCPTIAPGRHCNGFRFANQDLSIAYAADLDASAGFTAAMWFRLDTTPATQQCMYAQSVSAGNDLFVLCIEPDGTVLYDGESSTGASDGINSAALSINTWHHVAFVWDGTSKLAYADGSLIAQHAIVTGMATMPIGLGGDLDGTLDDAVFYTRALTATEITKLATP